MSKNRAFKHGLWSGIALTWGIRAAFDGHGIAASAILCAAFILAWRAEYAD